MATSRMPSPSRCPPSSVKPTELPSLLTPVTTPWTHRGVAAVVEDFPVNVANAAAPTATAQTRMNNAVHRGTATGVVNRDVAELAEGVMPGTVHEQTEGRFLHSPYGNPG